MPEIETHAMFQDLEWIISAAARQRFLLLLSVACIVLVSLAASLALLVAKSYYRVRNFDGPSCHWIKGHLDEVSKRHATFWPTYHTVQVPTLSKAIAFLN